MQDTNNKPDTRDVMNQWRKDVKYFFKKELIDVNVKNVNEDDIKKMWEWELMFFQYYCGMGMDDIFNEVGIIEDWKISYYRKYIYVFETHKDMGPWFLVLKSFKWLENYGNGKDFDIYYHNKYAEQDGFENKYKFKNFKVVDLNFWNYVLVNKKYFNDYSNFIKELLKKYGVLRESFFWLHITKVSKIYHSDNKEHFLLSTNTWDWKVVKWWLELWKFI